MQNRELLLTIDSTSKIWSVSVFADGKELQTSLSDKNIALSKNLVSQISEMLIAHNLLIKDITRIGVCIGPGSFTGLRVGISVAQGLAQAVGCLCIGVSLLEVLRLSGVTIPQNQITSLITTNQNQIYLQDYKKHNSEFEEEPKLISIETFLARYFHQRDVVLITNQESYKKLEQLFAEDILSQIQVAPNNLSTVLGKELSKNSSTIHTQKPIPLYL